MKIITVLFVLCGISVLLVGCSTEAERLSECQAKGISRDICYAEDKADRRAAVKELNRISDNAKKAKEK